jgi:phage tail-like protein
MAGMARQDPLAKWRFGVEIDGLLVGRFVAVAGVSAEGEVVEFQEGGRNDGLRKLPGQGRLGVLRLRRGWAAEPALWQWVNEGPPQRRTADVIVLHDDGSEAARYSLQRAWPLKWQAEDFDATQGAAAIETLELAYEGLVYTAGARGAPGPGAGASGLAGRMDDARRAVGTVREAVQAAQSAMDAVQGAIPQVPQLPQLPVDPGALGAVLQGRPQDLAAGALDVSWAAQLTQNPDAQQAIDTASQVQASMRGAVDQAQQARDRGASGLAASAADQAKAAAMDGVPAPFQSAVEGQPPVAPPEFAPQASVGGRAFAHADAGPAGGASAGAPWSDGAAPVQSGAAFGQPPLRRGGGFSVGR